MTVGLAIVVAVITGVSKLYKDPGFENDADAPFTMTIFEKLGTPVGALVIAIPVVATLVALAFSLHPQRRRIWIGSSVVIFVAMLFNIVLMNFLVVGGFLIYAAWRSRRIEDPPPPRVRRGAGAEAADADVNDEADLDDGDADDS